MLARLQQFITFLLIVSTLVWTVGFWSAGRPIWACLGALLILLGYALFLGAEFVMLHFLQTDDVAPRPRIRQLLRAPGGAKR